ncbi:hypothetical protein L873DRAFT_1753200 [Choiromyces venosus 120613-1]|uniref:Methyltransferase type 11 domain-containing protein n=1 Tax=Choiromyces venosus 120613-1 TaxID=1336337 RepID=A0A3N4IXX2_9PEZI|nr:hypothetical protein L873DRAFT_1753200 [Choiromyces venosus 120613-1]
MAYRDQQQRAPHQSSQLSLPKLRLKPSSSKLRSEQSSPPPAPTTRRLLHEHTFASSRRAESPVLLHPRKSSLPKPMSVINSPTMTPVTTLKPRTSPPSRSNTGFGGSTVSLATASPEKRPRTLIRRKPSSSSAASFSLTSLRTGSTTSFTASTASITSSSSLVGGSRNGSQSSILGIPLPPTSTVGKPRSKSSSSTQGEVPRLRKRDLQIPAPINVYDSGASSSPSTRYTESPGGYSYSSTPSSISSHSPGFPPAHHRFRNPTPPVRNNLDSVRESTTSTSSGSTIRANPRDEDSDSEDGGVRTEQRSTGTMSPPPTVEETYFAQLGSASAPNTPFYQPVRGSPRLAPQAAPSPSLLSATYSKTPSPALVVRGRKGSTSSTSSRLGTPELGNMSRGLGVSIPPQAPSSRLAKGRSKSLSSTAAFALPTRASRKETATPPLPSPGHPPPRKNSNPIARGPTPQPRDPITIQNSLYHNIPATSLVGSISAMAKRGESKDRSGREKSPTRSSPGKSRPSFFSRGRTKTSESMEEKEREKEKERERKVEKEKRKGPVAGTGHEGYAAFGKQITGRGRSGSTGGSSIGSYARSGSTSSTTGGSLGRTAGSRRGSAGGEPDDYLLDRLKPVVIVGGGAVVENRNTGESMIRTGSTDSNKEKRSLDIGKRGPSPVYMSREGSSDSMFKIPGRNTTPKLPPSPGPEAPPRKSGRWNFLRSGSASSSRGSVTPSPVLTPAPPITPVPTATSGAVPATTVRKAIHTHRRQPHYALLDQEELQEAAQLAEQVRELRREHAHPTNNYANAIRQQGGIHEPPTISQQVTPLPTPQPTPVMLSPPSLPAPPPPPPTLLPPPPISSPPPLSKSAPPNAPEQVRKEVRAAKANERKYFQRLQQVGRIPPVTRTRTPSLPQNVPMSPPPASPKTVPVASLQAPPQAPPQALPHTPLREKRPMQKLPPIRTKVLRAEVEANTAPPRMDRPFEEGFRRANEGFQVPWGSYGLTPTTAIHRPRASCEIDPFDIRGARAAAMVTEIPDDDTPIARPRDTEWPIRKDSTTSIPLIAQPVPEPVEEAEDFWPEYNDLIDAGLFGEATIIEPEVDEEQPGTKSTTSSLGSPFRYEDLCSAFPDLRDDDEGVKLNEEEEVDNKGEPKVNDSPTLRNAPPTLVLPSPLPIVNNPPFTPPAYKILTPGTPFSVSSFIRSYGDDRDRDSRGTINSAQSRNSAHLESSPPNLSLPSTSPRRRSHRSRGSGGSSGSQRSTDSTGSIDLDASQDEMTVRLWALMTSRWLSTDRVLVSPAHEIVTQITTAVGPRASGGGRVLVIDGLGTDDWSFYCALSYPSAKIYNLSPSLSSNPQTANTPPSPSRPQNHQQIHHEDFSSSFPFPKGFFNVISFRFLPSSSDSNLPFILSECRRVLEPGGYLEATVLDVDLLGNVGPKARKAVDLAKTIMHRENCTSSSSTSTQSEKVLRLLSKRGFEDAHKCFVGLPVVSNVPLTSGDEVNSAVLAKVGRWWYTRCYERVITSQGEVMGRSMWNERGLLKECEERKTAFRMLVAYARKPVRGVSAGGLI